MKKIIYTMGAALVMLASVSCKKNDAVKGEEQSSVKKVDMEFTAASKGALKTTVKPDGTTVVWSKDDVIKVFTAGDTQGSPLSLKSGEGKSTAVFSGQCSETGPWMAVYPSSAKDLSFASAGGISSVGFSMPATQTYAGATFATGTMLSVAYSATTDLEFKHVFGVLKLQLKGEGSVKSITVTDKTDDSKLNGYFVVNPGAMGFVALNVPDVEYESTASITLDCGDGVALNTSTATEFWFVVPQGAFKSGFDAVITSTDGKTAELSTTNDNEIKAGEIKPMPEKNIEFKAPATTGEAEITGGTMVKWVQLWAGGPKWAEYNVGATSVGDYGGYYQWGSVINEDNSANFYNGTENIQGGAHDTAKNLWGGNWQMPTKADYEDLFSNCDVTFYTGDNKYKGLNGMLCQGKEGYSENEVFFIYAGQYTYHGPGTYDVGKKGYYWTTTPDEGSTQYSQSVYIPSDSPFATYYRDYGLSVRAVLAE